jgi:hypothetical protein
LIADDDAMILKVKLFEVDSCALKAALLVLLSRVVNTVLLVW